MFAVHPIDGSYLIWVVDWLDEYHPGSFRQAQVSFSTRIPNAFPLGDATTMSHNVCLYHTSGSSLQLAFRDVVKTAAAAPTRSPSVVHGQFIVLFFSNCNIIYTYNYRYKWRLW